MQALVVLVVVCMIFVGADAFSLLATRASTSFRRRMSPVSQSAPPDPITLCPGDPSLVLHTNVALGEGKSEFMQASSRAISEALGKPESYIAVCVHDGASLIFAGSADPAAVGCVYSIGSINQANNAALTKAISDLLIDFGVPANRIYLNFFDVPRANCGWSGRTFAG